LSSRLSVIPQRPFVLSSRSEAEGSAVPLAFALPDIGGIGAFDASL
jgi:hypothetical protein